MSIMLTAIQNTAIGIFNDFFPHTNYSFLIAKILKLKQR